MNSTALISVIVPVYNVEEYLSRSVNSIVNQTYSSLEIILVDDGSPDQCPAMCDELARKDPRIRVLHKANGGVSSARNAGLRIAEGEWISFVDADDWIHPQFFEILVSEGEKRLASVISAGHVRTAKQSACDKILSDQLMTANIPPDGIGSWENRFYVWGKLYRRDVLSGFYFDESLSYGEDVCFNFMILYQHDIKIVDIDAVLYYYYIRKGSLVDGNRAYKRVQLCKASLSYAKGETNEARKAAYIVYTLKRGISTRFDIRREKDRRASVKQCDAVIRDALQAYRRCKAVSWKEYAKYETFFRFPFLYSAFRLINDPSLFQVKNDTRAGADPA